MTVRVGIVGGGQLARMMGEAGANADVETTVLATSPTEPAAATTDHAIVGAADDEGALRRLAAVVDVVTFDHELVDVNLLDVLAHDGVVLRPGPDALRHSVDKAHQRRRFAEAGIPVPRFAVATSADDPAVDEFLAGLDGPPVVKAARGGYDGRGVAFPASAEETRSLVAEWTASGSVVLEERLDLVAEVAQSFVCGVQGEVGLYPPVRTVQRGGMCVEVRYPVEMDEELVAEATRVTHRVAEVVGAIGVVAVEYFVTSAGLLVNEIALRPHNSGHWTIEGAATSQFVAHLRAVSGQPIGDLSPIVDAAVMVNVVGGDRPTDFAAARAVDGLAVHDYGKTWRPGRKLGHVTATDTDLARAHVRAWRGARAAGSKEE